MKRDLTTAIGFLFLGAAVLMFILWLYMAAQHLPVVGLEHYYVWGSALMGVTLIVMPQEKMIMLIVEFWEAVIKRFTK